MIHEREIKQQAKKEKAERIEKRRQARMQLELAKQQRVLGGVFDGTTPRG